MAQTADANLVTAAFDTRRIPKAKVEFDWGDDGFSSQNLWTNETEHLVSLEGTMAAVGIMESMSAVGHAVTNNVRVVLQNAKQETGYRRFALSEPNGVLSNQIGDGLIKFKRANVQMGFYYAGANYYTHQITGYVMDASESQDGATVQFDIRDRSVELMTNRASTTLYHNETAATYIDALLDEMTSDTMDDYGTTYIDQGMYPVQYYWCDDDILWEEISTVAQAHMGRVFFDKDGDFHFQDAGYFVRERNTAILNPKGSQVTLNDDDFSSAVPVFDLRRSYNRIAVEYTPRYNGGIQTLYKTPEIWIVPPDGGTKTFYAKFRYPAISVITPVLGEDYSVVSPGGLTIDPADYSVSFTFYATGAKVVVTNNDTDYALLISGMNFRGEIAMPRQQSKYVAEENGADFYTTWRPKNPYIQRARHAEAVAEFNLEKYSGHITGVRLTGVRGIPYIEVGDRITVNSDNLSSTSNEYFITRIHWRYPPYTMDLDLIRCDDLFDEDEYFIIGGGEYTASKYGNVSGHGHLFW